MPDDDPCDNVVLVHQEHLEGISDDARENIENLAVPTVHEELLGTGMLISSAPDEKVANLGTCLDHAEASESCAVGQGHASGGEIQIGDGEPGVTVPEDLKHKLKELPLHIKLALRRDLALEPFEVALRSLEASGPYEAVAQLMAEAGDETSVARLRDVLGRSFSCWCFSRQANRLDCAQSAFGTDEVRRALLQSLCKVPEEGSVASVVRRHVGRDKFRDVYQLGKPLLMLLLGAAPDEPGVLPMPSTSRPAPNPQAKVSKLKKKPAAQATVTKSQTKNASDSSSDSVDVRMANGKRKKANATMKFLEEFRAKRKRLREVIESDHPCL